MGPVRPGGLGGVALIHGDDLVGVGLNGVVQGGAAVLDLGDLHFGGGAVLLVLEGAEGDHPDQAAQNGHLLHGIGHPGSHVGQGHQADHGGGRRRPHPAQPTDRGEAAGLAPADGLPHPALQLRGDGDGVVFLFPLCQLAVVHVTIPLLRKAAPAAFSGCGIKCF